MKAAVWHGGEDIRVEEAPEPRVGPDDVLIRVEYAGVCGSDLHLMDGWLIQPPAVLGHEFAGVVEAKGENVTVCIKGDRVVAHPLSSCGQCAYCRSGRQNLCRKPARVLSHGEGAFAEYTVVNARSVFVLPDSVGLSTAALVEPVSIAVHVTSLAGIQPGSFVVVFGAGTIGLLCLKMAKQAGARSVAVVEPCASRQDTALRLGADFAASPGEIKDLVDTATGGLGPDVCIEGVGAIAAVEQAIQLARPGGRVVIAGWSPPHATATVKPAYLFRQEIGIQGSFWSSYSAFGTAVDLVQAWGLELASMVTVFEGLGSLREAVALMRGREVIKPLIKIV